MNYRTYLLAVVLVGAMSSAALADEPQIETEIISPPAGTQVEAPPSERSGERSGKKRGESRGERNSSGDRTRGTRSRTGGKGQGG